MWVDTVLLLPFYIVHQEQNLFYAKSLNSLTYSNGGLNHLTVQCLTEMRLHLGAGPILLAFRINGLS
jgi:hypothetical protein